MVAARSSLDDAYRLRSTHSLSNNKQTDHDWFATLHCPEQKSPCPLILGLVITHQVADQNVGVVADHSARKQFDGHSQPGPFLQNSSQIGYAFTLHP